MSVWNKIFTWLFRIFTYIVPSGVVLWEFLISKLISNEVSFTQKIGLSGIMTITVIGLIAVFFLGKFIRKKIQNITNDCIECCDNNKKMELVLKKKKWELIQDRFHNICFIAPFIIVWAVLTMVENGVVSLRGTFLEIIISMAVGFGFNEIARWFSSKGNKKNENTASNN